MRLMKLDRLAAIRPVIIGEHGCNMDPQLGGPQPDMGFDPDPEHEFTSFRNSLSIFNDWGLHLCSWWWAPNTRFSEHSGYPDYVPNEAGQIVIDAIAARER